MYGEHDNGTIGSDANDAETADKEGTDNYSMDLKVLFTCVNVPFLVFGVLALVALNRTRRTPPTAR